MLLGSRSSFKIIDACPFSRASNVIGLRAEPEFIQLEAKSVEGISDLLQLVPYDFAVVHAIINE